jgi:stress response protein YsnF
MDAKPDDVVVPIVSEELHVDAVPVETGGVRVTKHVEGHDEVLEQELRKGRVEVKRVKTERVVDGPQAIQREGNRLIIPVVSEVLHVEKRWVVTEEIHLTQLEERETVQQKVRVNHEEAVVERVDETGHTVSTVDAISPQKPSASRATPESLVARKGSKALDDASAPKRKILSGSQSILKNKT